MGKKFLYGFFATLLVFMVGFFGLSATFSDLGPGETWAIRIAIVFAVCFVGSVGVGFLLHKWWPAAVACSWGFLLGEFWSQWELEFAFFWKKRGEKRGCQVTT